jgi:hypothetical protein
MFDQWPPVSEVVAVVIAALLVAWSCERWRRK